MGVQWIVSATSKRLITDELGTYCIAGTLLRCSHSMVSAVEPLGRLEKPSCSRASEGL